METLQKVNAAPRCGRCGVSESVCKFSVQHDYFKFEFHMFRQSQICASFNRFSKLHTRESFPKFLELQLFCYCFRIIFCSEISYTCL